MDKIKWQGFLLTTADIKRSRDFYENVLNLEVISAVEDMIEFEDGFTLYDKDAYIKIVAGDQAERATGRHLKVTSQPNNFQLYFEVENLDDWVKKITSALGIEVIHDAFEYNWGQKVFRFYDYDKHIVEVSESIQSVFDRLYAQGLILSEIAERFGDSIETIQKQFPKQ